MSKRPKKPQRAKKRRRQPGDEVASNLDERIDRARHQARRPAGKSGADPGQGLSDPRYDAQPLKNDLEQQG